MKQRTNGLKWVRHMTDMKSFDVHENSGKI